MLPGNPLALTLLLSGLLAGVGARAEAPHPPHGHAAPADGGPKLTLNQGKKWPTDAPLREGMTAIRGAVAGALERVHAGRYSPAQYEALAAKVEAQAASIMTRCKLPPDADAQLHLVLADVFAATEAMKGTGKREAGVVKLVQALDTYGAHFEHAGWKRLAH